MEDPMHELQNLPDLREVSMPIAKIRPLVLAWSSPGTSQSHHDRAKSALKRSWPRLYGALVLLIDGDAEEWAHLEANRTIVAMDEISKGITHRVSEALECLAREEDELDPAIYAHLLEAIQKIAPGTED